MNNPWKMRNNRPFSQDIFAGERAGDSFLQLAREPVRNITGFKEKVKPPKPLLLVIDLVVMGQNV